MLTEMNIGEIKTLSSVKKVGINRSHLQTAAKKGWLLLTNREVYRQLKTKYQHETTKKELNFEQEQVFQAIKRDIGSEHNVFLLEGITGSGKTEVYLHLIEEALSKELSALMLVPEITLTPQMVSQLQARFGEQVAVLHSGLSEGEKYDEWRKIERDEAHVVVGARSAIFAPLKNIGLIIIDEEHESSYQQEETPKYQAKDIAKWRGNYHQAPVVFGSATPSLESMARAVKGNYQLLKLTKRANPHAKLPKTTIIDMTKAQKVKPLLSIDLVQAISDCLQKNEQSVLLLNKRGYASFMLCEDCGYVLECPNCSVSLTMHQTTNSMQCHYCGHTERIPQSCPICQSRRIQFYGAGTQKIEEYLNQLFPEARIIRMDVDTTRKKGQHEQLLSNFRNKEADILLGTQMIAKGLDFPDVTLVGVLNADTALNLPDFRSSERTFQLLTQVSGRAGRHQKEGNVYIQTYNPKHYAIQFAKDQNYEDFFKYEMQVRHLGSYSPYFYTIQIIVGHKQEYNALKESQDILRRLTPYLNRNLTVLGPTKTAIERVNQYYYYQITIKYKNDSLLLNYLKQLLEETQYLSRQGYQIKITKEPNNFI